VQHGPRDQRERDEHETNAAVAKKRPEAMRESVSMSLHVRWSAFARIAYPRAASGRNAAG
jgi:hypothetical protein